MLALTALVLLSAAPPDVARLATLPIPGDARFVAAAREVVDVAFALDPSAAAGAGLYEDALRVPSFDPRSVEQQVGRLDAALKVLRALPWREWPVDRQVDFRWMYLNAEAARHQLVVERLFERRPAAWLEPYANTLIAFETYAPEVPRYRSVLWQKLPALLGEVRRVATQVTRRDLDTARKLTAALLQMAQGSPEAREAQKALAAYAEELAQQKPAQEFQVVGSEAYAWRYRHAMLLPWTPASLLETAQRELATVEARIAQLKPKLKPKAEATAAQKKQAEALTAEGLLRLYDDVTASLRKATLAGKFVTVVPGVGPLRARQTPEAVVPLSGDGGSMNPPPPFAAFDVGYWNVERFAATWSPELRLETVVDAQAFRENSMGPYAAHEGFPGHHLQLAIARLNKNPLRSLLADPGLTEGWALYIEEVLWKHGGLGGTVEAEVAMLKSLRYRIARVVYDVKIETGEWTLQQAAEFKFRNDPKKVTVDEDLLRSIQWPSQLVTYYAGRSQLRALREEYRQRKGAKYSERAFHDAVLAEGSIPVALIRAKLLGEPVPDIELEPSHAVSGE